MGAVSSLEPPAENDGIHQVPNLPCSGVTSA
jgi:hypothetical protein